MFQKYSNTLLVCVKCTNCGVIFNKYNNKSKNNFCSRICYAKWLKTNFVGKNNPFYGRRHTYLVKEKMRLYHTKPLLGKKLSEETKEKISKSKTEYHPYRGKHLTFEHRKRISLSHKGKKLPESARNKLKGRVPWNKGKKLSREIRQKISKSLKGLRVGEKHPLFGLRGKLSPTWKDGISFLPYCPKFNKELKEKIRERDNRTCQLCNEKENGRKLSVHHVHYDKPNCDPDLISLCLRCNCKANFNRDFYEKLFMEKLRKRSLV